MYDKRDDFDFDIVNFPFLDGDVPRRPSYGVYILIYRKTPSYNSIVILIFIWVRSNTGQIRMKLRPCNANLMCSRNRGLTYS